jgi:hypothetical protein
MVMVMQSMGVLARHDLILSRQPREIPIFGKSAVYK